MVVIGGGGVGDRIDVRICIALPLACARALFFLRPFSLCCGKEEGVGGGTQPLV